MKQIIWIGIEGIGGAGKTLQLNMLESALPDIYPNINIHLEREFSENKIGNYLNSNIDNNNFRIRKTHQTNNIINHLLIIADRLAKIRELLAKKTLNVIILDRFILSDIVHALTDGKIELGSSLYYNIMDAFDSIYKTPTFVNSIHSLYYFYFDCPIEVACKRLAKRNQIKINKSEEDFLIRLRNNYKHVVNTWPNTLFFNTNKTSQKIHLEVINSIGYIIDKNLINK